MPRRLRIHRSGTAARQISRGCWPNEVLAEGLRSQDLRLEYTTYFVALTEFATPAASGEAARWIEGASR